MQGRCHAGRDGAATTHGMERPLTQRLTRPTLCTQVGFCARGRPTLTVTEPPRVAWSEAAHEAFPGSFRAAAAALLLCLHRLAQPFQGASECPCCGSPQPCAGAAYGIHLPHELVRARPARY